MPKMTLDDAFEQKVRHRLRGPRQLEHARRTPSLSLHGCPPSQDEIAHGIKDALAKSMEVRVCGCGCIRWVGLPALPSQCHACICFKRDVALALVIRSTAS